MAWHVNELSVTSRREVLESVFMGKEADTDFGSSPVAGSDEFDSDAVTRTLIKDLELDENIFESRSVSWEKNLTGLRDLSPASFRAIGLDISVVCGLSGDWPFALKCVNRLVQENDDRIEVKIWELRCLVECGRYAEGLALAQSVRWEKDVLIHVNYLTGCAFDALGMKSQAQLRFDAVRRQDPNYKEVRFK